MFVGVCISGVYGGGSMIGLIDVDGKLPNLALMKISSYYKSIGEQVEFVQDGHNYDRIYGSAIFTKSADKCQELIDKYGDAIQIGGTGWDITGTLPPEIDGCRPDYDLYTIDDVLPGIRGVMTRSTRIKKAQQIVDAGIGFTSRGCVRKCPFCEDHEYGIVEMQAIDNNDECIEIIRNRWKMSDEI